jgi:predicted amidohydrolase
MVAALPIAERALNAPLETRRRFDERSWSVAASRKFDEAHALRSYPPNHFRSTKRRHSRVLVGVVLKSRVHRVATTTLKPSARVNKLLKDNS